MPRTVEDLRAMNVIDPAYAEAVKARPMFVPEPGKGTIDRRIQRAEHLSKLRHLYPIPGPIPEVKERNLQIQMRDGHNLTVRVYSPDASLVPADGSPLYVAMHEGGWCMGDLTDEDINCRLLARDLGCICVNIDYRLAPEHPFPTQINDCWDVLQHLTQPATSTTLAYDLHQGFIVGGASAGGNLSAILAQQSRDERLTPPVTGQVLVVPAVLPPQYTPAEYKYLHISDTENEFDPVLRLQPRDAQGKRPAMYEGLKEVVQMDLDSALFNPFANNKGFSGLCPAYLQVAGLDPIRDQGLIYADVLRDQGVEVRCDVYAGYGHMWWTNYPSLPASDKVVGDFREGVRWLLDRRWKPSEPEQGV